MRSLVCLTSSGGFDPHHGRQYSGIVQSVEHQTLNLSVGGSSPSSGSNNWGSALERQQQGLQNLRMSVRIRSSPPNNGYTMKELIQGLLDGPDREIDEAAKELIRKWSNPPTYEEVYDTVAQSCHFSLVSDFVMQILMIIEEDAKKRSVSSTE